MNDKQMNWLRMYRKVKGVVANNTTMVAQYAPIEKSFITFDELLIKIEELASEKARTTKGVYVSKQELKEIMAREAAELASAAYVYAKDSGNAELAAVLNVSYSDLRYGDDQTALSMATAIYNELSGLLVELEDYLISPADIDTLKQANWEYQASLENTQAQDSVARTRQLAGLFKQANEHLREHLDKLMNRIQRKEPVFFDTYTNARVILDLGAGRKKETPSEMME